MAYHVALFVHLVGLVTLASGFAVALRGGVQMRRAETAAQVRLWGGLLRQTPRMIAAGLVMLLVSGLYMAGQVWGWVQPWIIVGVAGSLAIGVLTGAVQGRRLESIADAAATAVADALPTDLARRVRAPWPLVTTAAMNGVALGVVWLMVTKPGWAGPIITVAVASALGAVAGTLMLRAERLSGESTPVREE